MYNASTRSLPHRAIASVAFAFTLATGAALVGLRALVEQAGGTVVGAGVAIEKVFQGGGNQLRADGLRVESLAKIASMDEGGIVFER